MTIIEIQKLTVKDAKSSLLTVLEFFLVERGTLLKLSLLPRCSGSSDGGWLLICSWLNDPTARRKVRILQRILLGTVSVHHSILTRVIIVVTISQVKIIISRTLSS